MSQFLSDEPTYGKWEIETEFPDWQPIETAPTDGTIVNVMGRYKDATAGFPRYAGFMNGEWHEFSRHLPEPLVVWAWRERDPHSTWPRESNPPKVA